MPRAGRFVAAYKVSKRFDQDIAAVCAAFAIDLEGDTIRQARIAFGGMAATPSRARRTETDLVGQQWSLQTIERAAQALSSDFQPLTDMRASRDYRMQSAQNALLRCFYDRNGELPDLQRLASGA